MTPPDTVEGAFDNEVFILPGRCVAWKCYAPVSRGIACSEHAPEFETGRTEARTFILTPEDLAMKATMPPDEWSRYRKKAYMRHRRAADPNYCPGQHTREVAIRMATQARVAQADAGRQQRREMILAELREHGCVSTADIVARFGVSADTVKTQLARMAEEGVLERIYGGAKIPGVEVRGGALRRPQRAS